MVELKQLLNVVNHGGMKAGYGVILVGGWGDLFFRTNAIIGIMSVLKLSYKENC